MAFKLVAETKLNGRTAVHKYLSERTGLRVVFGDVDGPICNGYFVLATEAHDDDGLPHTLEHLIFLGSERYPFKGALDLLANRCLASGTNAWTDTDHTCYTMTTAGSDGFMALLPIYLDHVLYPTLSVSGFVTEVHHVNGEGLDGGVVYCEMQGRENSDISRTFLKLLRSIYPDCGYSAETGGLMENLRTSTDNKKVRAYHAAFYRPENLTIIITGQVDKERVFACLAQFEEERILPKGERGPYERPWQNDVLPLAESKVEDIVYPSDEEDSGMVYIGWRGPRACSAEHAQLTACSVLLRFLSDTSISPLQQVFVEVDDPLASQVNYSIIENSQSLLYLAFENVPLEKIDLVVPTLQTVLEKLMAREITFGLQRMRNVLEKMILEALSVLEEAPHDTVAYAVIGDSLYGHCDQDFQIRLNVVDEYKQFLDKDESFWLELLGRYLVSNKSVVVRNRPSIAEQKRMTLEEQNRIEEQRKKLGAAGLAQKQEELNKAIQANEANKPSTETLTEVPIPDTADIKFHDVEIIRANSSQNVPGLSLNDMPMGAECYSINTNFVYLTVTMDTASLTPEQRLYLPLLLELLMESPIIVDGTEIPYEEVVSALESDTVSCSRRVGLQDAGRFSCGPYSNYVLMSFQVTPENYAKGIEWIKRILFNTHFAVDRIRVCAAKIANDVAQAKRAGDLVLKSLIKSIVYKPKTNVHLSSLLMQHRFLTQLMSGLDKPATASAIIASLYKVRDALTCPNDMTVHMAADWKTLAARVDGDLLEPWRNFFPAAICGDNKCAIQLGRMSDCSLIKPDRTLSDGALGCIVGVGSVESSYLVQVVPSIASATDPDLPALMLFLQYLTQLEGSMWRQIRGQGYAYGYSVIPRPHEGLLSLMFYKATNVVAAYKETRTIIEETLNGSGLDETLFESARSSLIFEIVEREKNIGDLVTQALLASFRDVPVQFNQQLVKSIGQVRKESLIEIGRKYVLPLFSQEARTAIVCHPEKAAELGKAFASMDRPLEVKITVEESILADGYDFDAI